MSTPYHLITFQFHCNEIKVKVSIELEIKFNLK
jgi:hypothetical protein